MRPEIRKTVIDGKGNEYGIGDALRFHLMGSFCTGILHEIEEARFKLRDVRIDGRPLSQILIVRYEDVEEFEGGEA